MTRGFLATMILILAMIVSMGCLSAEPPQVQAPATTPVPTPSPEPAPESPVSTVLPSAMALQLSDIPPDYILKDRADSTYEEQTQLTRDLGWRQGYSVSFYRINLEKFDLTAIRQDIGVYPPERMNRVFDLAEDDMESQGNDTIRVYQIPLYRIGDDSIAYKTENTRDSGRTVVYTILFIKKDVFEKLEMGGTTTDYETLKQLAAIAADRIR